MIRRLRTVTPEEWALRPWSALQRPGPVPAWSGADLRAALDRLPALWAEAPRAGLLDADRHAAAFEAGDLRWIGDPSLCWRGPVRYDQLPGFAPWPATPSRRLDAVGLSPILGDVRRLWNVGKGFHLPVLAQARGADATYAAQRVFLGQAPPGRGPHWVSGLEIAERALHWIFALLLLPSAPPDDVAAGLAAHGAQLAAHLTPWSYNHAVGEATGLLALGTLLGGPTGRRWAELARVQVVNRALALIDRDGAWAERTPGYASLVYQYLRLAESLGADVGEARSRLGRSLARLALADGQLPRRGDDDDATLALYPPRRVPLAAHPLWGEGQLPPPRVAITNGAWGQARLTQGAAEVSFYHDQVPAPGAGLAVAAPHSHDDVLHVSAWYRGESTLVDSGVFGYNQDPRRRAFDRSEDAHNGPRPADRRPAVQAGPWRWSRLARGQLVGISDQADWSWAVAHREDGSARRWVALHALGLVVIDHTHQASVCRWVTRASYLGEPWFSSGSAARVPASWAPRFALEEAGRGWLEHRAPGWSWVLWPWAPGIQAALVGGALRVYGDLPAVLLRAERDRLVVTPEQR